MAQLFYYWKVTTGNALAVLDSSSGYGISSTGWTVAKLTPLYWPMVIGTEQTTGYSASHRTTLNTSVPDFFVTPAVQTGTFATGNWTFRSNVAAVDKGGSQDGRVCWRLWKGTNSSGTGATAVTNWVTSNTCTDIAISSVGVYCGYTGSISSFSLANEYLFIQVDWEILGAGAASSCDVRLGYGKSSTAVDFANVITGVSTADFASGISGSGSVGTVNISAPAGSGQISAFDQYRLKMTGVGK